MKLSRPKASRTAALTLLEIVVALVVVAVLAVLLFPSIQEPREASPNAKAGTVVKDIVNACKAYETDYGEFPRIAAAVDERGGAGNPYLSFGDVSEGRCKVDNSQLFNVLRAISAGPNTGHVLNLRQIRYFEDGRATDKQRPRKGFTDGPEFPDEMRGRLMDPWGHEYLIVLETDRDEALNLGAFYQDLAPPEKTLRTPVTAFSMGKDGRLGGKDFPGMIRKPKSEEAADDVASWN